MEKTRIKNKGVRARREAGTMAARQRPCFLAVAPRQPTEGMNGPSGQVALDFSVEGIEKVLPVTRAALASGATVRVIAYKSGDSNPATENYANECAYYWNGTKLVPCRVDANGNKTADLPDWAMTLLPGTYDFMPYHPPCRWLRTRRSSRPPSPTEWTMPPRTRRPGRSLSKPPLMQLR